MLDNWVKLRILVSHIFRHQGIFYCVIHGTWEFHFPGDVGGGGGGGQGSHIKLKGLPL